MGGGIGFWRNNPYPKTWGPPCSGPPFPRQPPQPVPAPVGAGVGGEDLAVGSAVGCWRGPPTCQQWGKRHSGFFGLYLGLVYGASVKSVLEKENPKCPRGRVTAASEGRSGHKEEAAPGGAGNSLLDTDKSSGALQKSKETNTELLPSTGRRMPGSVPPWHS